MKALLEFIRARKERRVCSYTSVFMHVSMYADVHTGPRYQMYFPLCISHGESRKKMLEEHHAAPGDLAALFSLGFPPLGKSLHILGILHVFLSHIQTGKSVKAADVAAFTATMADEAPDFISKLHHLKVLDYVCFLTMQEDVYRNCKACIGHRANLYASMYLQTCPAHGRNHVR